MSQYAPLPGAPEAEGRGLDDAAHLSFVTEKGTPRAIKFSGTARIDRLARRAQRRYAALFGQERRVALARLDPLERSIAVDRIAIDAAEMDVRRFAGGDSSCSGCWTPADHRVQRRQRKPSAPARAWQYSIAEAQLANGTLRIAGLRRFSCLSSCRCPTSSWTRKRSLRAARGHRRCRVRFRGGRAFRRACRCRRGRPDRPRPFLAHRISAGQALSVLRAGAQPGRTARDTSTWRAISTFAASASPMQVTLTGGSATLADLEMGFAGRAQSAMANSARRSHRHGLRPRQAAKSRSTRPNASRPRCASCAKVTATVDFQRLVRAKPRRCDARPRRTRRPRTRAGACRSTSCCSSASQPSSRIAFPDPRSG